MYLLVIQNLSGDDFRGLSKILRPLRFPEACLSWGGFWQERQDLNPRTAVLEFDGSYDILCRLVSSSHA